MKQNTTKFIRYSVYSLVSTEVLTRPSSPSRPVLGDHFNPPRDIPEQLAAYSTKALSTALVILQLGGLRRYWINCLAQGQTKVPRPGIEPATYWLLVQHLTNWAKLSPPLCCGGLRLSRWSPPGKKWPLRLGGGGGGGVLGRNAEKPFNFSVRSKSPEQKQLKV